MNPPAPLTYSNYRWTVMGIWLFSSVSSFMVLNTLGILLPAISADLSLSPSQQGLLGSASHWGNIALAIPLSWATSRLSPKWLTAGALAMATACLFLQSWAPVFIVLLAGRLVVMAWDVAAVYPQCQEDNVLVGRGDFSSGRWESYVCGPTEDDLVQSISVMHGKDYQRILEKEFGKLYSLNGVYELMHRLGYSWLMPRPQHEKADPQAQEDFKKTL